MTKRIITNTILGLLFAIQCGCSVGMALHGKPEPNLGAIEIGQKRSIVLLNLGQPAKTLQDEAGRIDVFELERGNAPSAGRAVGHAAMDVLTFGAWEIIGAPVEGFIGDKFSLTIHYDNEDKVSKMSTGPVQKGF